MGGLDFTLCVVFLHCTMMVGVGIVTLGGEF